MAEKVRPLWFKDGINFECTGCGDCCRSPEGEDGFVYLNGDEIEAISKYLKLDKKTFLKEYTEKRSTGIVVRDPQLDCIFMKDNRCEIYEVRPAQCRTWPFWEIALVKRNWESKVLTVCPGIGKGRHYSLEEIKKISEELSPL